jgi:hypothetical protein
MVEGSKSIVRPVGQRDAARLGPRIDAVWHSPLNAAHDDRFALILAQGRPDGIDVLGRDDHAMGCEPRGLVFRCRKGMLLTAEDHDETSCPFCTGNVAPDIIEMIMESAASQMTRMSIEEFRRSLDGSGRDALDVR